MAAHASVGLGFATSMALAAPIEWRFDLDGDGASEVVRAVAREIVVHSTTMDERYPLPEGVPPPAEGADDPGIRFVDLNADGRADLLFSDESREALYLWNTVVRPDLGWTPGWSQKVRSGHHPNGDLALPPLMGTTVTIKDGVVIIQAPGKPEIRRSAANLIALPAPRRFAPDAAVATLRLPKGFSAELVAHEPQVVDPVAFDWGPDGTFWVVEMRDYPTGLDGRGSAGGRIKRLVDADGDGRFEGTMVFVDELPFPTGVMAWRKGILVAAAPDILYLADTDGDGRADIRETVFTGFEPGNQQHRFNGFEWGLDGWVYAANGDSGGTVRSAKSGKSLSISGRDVRFRPETGEIETVSGMTQYGLRRDDWGTWFGNNNPVWLWQVTLPERYLRRNPELAVPSVRRELANYPDPTRVFPVSPPMERPNQPWALNHVTSACSPTPYRDDLFGPGFEHSLFIAEPVHNTVHREVLHRHGSGWNSRRAEGEADREFLASTDNWFRPVFVRTGPDGALWVADMQRLTLEHPEWISPELQARLDLRAGSDAGRIFRIAPSGQPRRRAPNLAALDAAALAAAVDSPNGWQRDTAHRLLLEHPDRQTAVPALRALLAPSHAPAVRLQALAILGSLSALDEETQRAALTDPHEWVRCEALRQAEARPSAAVLPVVLALTQDMDPAVRLQAAFSLGAWPPGETEPALAALASDEDEDVRTAARSSLRPGSPLFQALKNATPTPVAAPLPPLAPSSPDRAKVIASYAGLTAIAGDAANGRTQFESLCATCHRLHGKGHAVGPDLDMTAAKPTAWMLAGILDPAQTVESRYRAWTVTLTDGATVTGIITTESANNLVLRLPGAVDHPILRRDIKAMTPVSGSLMPTGFESALPPAAMADLLRFLSSPIP